MIQGEHGIQCMQWSSLIISEMLLEIHAAENVIFSTLINPQIQSTLAISTLVISSNRLYRNKILVPVLT